jgi:peptide chain release factor-like protein
VALLAEERLAGPLQRLAREREDGKGSPGSAGLARTLEEAARSLEEWDERLVEEGRGRVWMVIRAQDALKPAREWVRDLTLLELAWCRRLHLSAELVAYESGQEQPSCTILAVEGPGARALLAMEEGQHRLVRGRGSALRARVDVVPQGPAPSTDAPSVSPARRHKGHFGLMVGFRGRRPLRAQGVTLDFVAGQQDVLAHVLADLSTAWSSPAPEAVLARVYGEDGRGARDPRTGAGVPRFKDAMKGRLQPLLDAWRRREPPAAEPSGSA